MTLDAQTWSRVIELLARVSELDPGQRAGAIAEADPEPEVREWLEQLLRAHDDSDEDLTDRIVREVIDARSDRAADADETLPDQIGSWRLVRELGLGDNGRVFLGERADGQYKQQVAIKLMTGPAPTPRQMPMFQGMVRRLMRLEHPGIIRLVDAGVDERSGTYLVMEYVRGEPIDFWCLKHHATLNRRVALIRQVANAVAHAHRRLVVHTDIKPENILVTAQGRVRVLDFGVGALMRDFAGPAHGVARCSPAWCAPEQLHGATPDVSQDVYGLGALMLRLLTGRRIRDSHLVIRWLCGLPDTPEPAPAPSAELLPGLPARRVRGDLDAICRRALALAPDHRYQSVEALDADLDRWRRDRPVSTRPLSPPAKFGRWVRRHWLPVAVAGIAGVAMAVGLIAARQSADLARVSAKRAMAQAERADSVRDLLLDMFRVADPLRAGGTELSTRHVLSGARRALSSHPELTPGIRLEVHNAVADVQRTRGWTEDAARMLQSARRLIEGTHELAPETRAETWLQQALLSNHLHDYDAALDWLDRATGELRGRSGEQADRGMARSLALRGSIQARLNRQVEATDALDRADELLFTVNPRMPEVELMVASARGAIAYARSEYQLALAHLEKALKLQRELGREHEAGMVLTLGNMAAVANEMGRPEDALAWDRKAVSIARSTLPQGHQQIGQALYSLGDTLRQLGRYSDALSALSEAAKIQRAAGMDGDFQRVELTRARTLFSVGDYPGALATAKALRSELSERWGEASREALLSLEVELASRALLGENPIPALRSEIQRRFDALPEPQRASPVADLLRWRLAEIALQYADPDAVQSWLEFQRGNALEPEHTSVQLRWMAIQIRRGIVRGDPPDPIREQRLLTALDQPGGNLDARAYAWCVLAESAMARDARAQLGEASGVLKTIMRERSLSDEMARMVMGIREDMMGG